MTRDGISTSDWDRVHAAAIDIVNASAIEDDVLSGHHRQNMMDILDELENKYGRLTSILDTRADFTEDPSEAISVYEEALASTDDREQICLILPSLIRLMIEENLDPHNISNKIQQLEQLGDLMDDYELNQLGIMQSDLQKMKKRNAKLE